MSARDIISELPKLTDAERQAVLEKLRELARQNRTTSDSHLLEGHAQVVNPDIDLEARGVSERQAADLRSRLKAFSEDWERPEAAIYDEDPSR